MALPIHCKVGLTRFELHSQVRTVTERLTLTPTILSSKVRPGSKRCNGWRELVFEGAQWLRKPLRS